jgi:beta-lactamase class C
MKTGVSMQKMFKFMSIMTFALVPFGTWAAGTADSATVAATVNQTIQTLRANTQTPGVAVELYLDGKPYSYYYGYAKPHNKTPVTDKTIFELGSISKVMTSLLLTKQIDVARMELSDSVEKYVKHLPDSFDDVTLKDLATHTSGLPFNVPDEVVTRAQFNNYLAAWSPEHDAGEQWEYSNMGIGMLGYALERAGHRSYNSLYIKNITAPLGMQPIGLTVSGWLRKNYAQGYDKDGNPVPQVVCKLFPAAGCVKASAHDMQRFLSAAIGLPGVPQKMLYPMRMTQAAYVRVPEFLQGLGWQIHQFTPQNAANLLHVENESERGSIVVQEQLEKPLFYSNALIDKTGGTDGFRAYIAVLPDKKSGVVILANKFIPKSEIVTAGRQILFKLNNIAQENKREVQKS